MTMNMIQGCSFNIKKVLNLAHPYFDLVITSPPYWEKDGYSNELISALGWRLAQIMKPGKLAFINFGDVGEEPGRAYKVQSILSRYLDFQFDIIWAFSFEGKGRFQPITTTKRPNRLHEKVLVFSSRGATHSINRLSVGIPFTDKSNIARRQHKIDKRCRGDIWFVPYENKTGQNFHQYKFPDELVRRCILLSGESNGNLLDPFAGGGTTLKVGHSMGFNSVGIEQSQELVDSFNLKVK